MGYTHYWKATHAVEDPEIKKHVIDKIKTVFKNAKDKGIVLAGGGGEKTQGYLLNEEHIFFNGFEDDSHESFSYYWNKVSFEFCKTARKPYDAVVVACLIILENQIEGFTWSSDGEGEEDYLDEALELLEITDPEEIANYKANKLAVDNS